MILPGAIVKPGTSKVKKTGQWRNQRPIFLHKDCIHCNKCLLVCPDDAVYEENKFWHANYDYCKGCGICANECPVNDIIMVKEVS